MPRGCLIREQPHYRRAAFCDGLKAAGYALRAGDPGTDVTPGDVLVIWNRYAHWEGMADRFERAGGTVLVAENGYLGHGGSVPKFDVWPGNVQPGHYYALAVGQHNGGGRWPTADGSRWRALGVEIHDWRDRGHHILVCAQRGIGPQRLVQRSEWTQDVVARLKGITSRPVRIRPHPGIGEGPVPLAKDLEQCWAVVIWASNAGIHALLAGIPVFYEGQHWILGPAGCRDIRQIDDPPLPDREPAFHRMACAQWTVAEIASGEPFKRLLALEVESRKSKVESVA